MQIRISQYAFTLSEPFGPGHVCTPGEAQALNSLRAENIRNNMAKLVRDEIAVLAEGTLLTAEQQQDLQVQISAYDAKYQFVFKHRPMPSMGPIELEALAIAEERLRAKAQSQGLLINELELRSKIEAEATTAEVQELARQRAGLRLSIAQSAADDLLSL